MKVGIAGGHGQIAMQLMPLLSERGDTPIALIRNPDHSEDVRAAGGESAVIDMESVGASAIAEAIAGCDAVVFAAGAGPDSGPERKETVDFGAAVKLIEACREAGVSRYVIVSSTGADANAEGDGFALYLRVKGRADEALAASGLDFTIVRPVSLTNDPATGKVHVGDDGAKEITRADVAAVLAETLVTESTIGKTFGVSEGETPIVEALTHA